MDCLVLSAREQKCNNDYDNDLHFATSIMNMSFVNKWWWWWEDRINGGDGGGQNIGIVPLSPITISADK